MFHEVCFPFAHFRHSLSRRESNHTPKTLRFSILFNENNSSLRDCRVAGQRILDFTQFKTYAIQFHLIINSTDDFNGSILMPATKIAGTVLTALCALQKTGLRQIRAVQITLTDTNSTKPDLTGNPWYSRTSIIIADLDTGIRQRPASRQKTLLVTLKEPHCTGNRIFSRAVGIEIAKF